MKSAADGTRVKPASENNWGESSRRYANEHTWCVLDALFAVAEEVGKTPAQVALNWVSQRPGVTSPIIGVRTMEQLEDNLGARGWSLTPEHMTALDRARHVTLADP